MNWLVLIMAFQIGTSDNTVLINKEQNIQNTTIWSSPEKSFYTEMINVSSFIKSYQYPKGDNFFYPFKIDYGFESFIDYKGFSIGFKHQCNHPVLSSVLQNNLIRETNTEIYARYEIKINPFE
jgi:hypothetical protein